MVLKPSRISIVVIRYVGSRLNLMKPIFSGFLEGTARNLVEEVMMGRYESCATYCFAQQKVMALW